MFFLALIEGSTYMDSCPIQPNIPVFMMVGGFFGVLSVTSKVVRSCLNRQEGVCDEDIHQPNPYESIINLFLLAWFVAGMNPKFSAYMYECMFPCSFSISLSPGNVWVYSIYGNFKMAAKSVEDRMYCDPRLYTCAFWTVTAIHIIIVAYLIYCLVLCISAFSGKQKLPSEKQAL